MSVAKSLFVGATWPQNNMKINYPKLFWKQAYHDDKSVGQNCKIIVLNTPQKPFLDLPRRCWELPRAPQEAPKAWRFKKCPRPCSGRSQTATWTFKMSTWALADVSRHQTSSHAFPRRQTTRKNNLQIQHFEESDEFSIPHVTFSQQPSVLNERNMHLTSLPKATTVWFRSTS